MYTEYAPLLDLNKNYSNAISLSNSNNIYNLATPLQRWALVASAVTAIAGIIILSLGAPKFFGVNRTPLLSFAGGATLVITTISGCGVYIIVRSIRNESELSDIRLNKEDLKITSGPLTMGQGEYILFYQPSEAGAKKEILEAVYKQAYAIFNHYSATEMAKRGERYADRYARIKEAIKQIDPELEIAFISRTLYGLFFVRACVEEDRALGDLCPNSERGDRLQYKYNEDRAVTMSRYEVIQTQGREDHCWHLCYFDNTHNPQDQEEALQKAAYRLNELIVHALKPTKEGCTFELMQASVEEHLTYLEQWHLEERPKLGGKKGKYIVNNNVSSPTCHFAVDFTRGINFEMAVKTEQRKQVLRNAVALECSRVAQDALFLYRGSKFAEDMPFKVRSDNKEVRPYALSYSDNLFSHVVFDGGATPFHHMCRGNGDGVRNAYAIAVPVDRFQDSPFYLPDSTALIGMYNLGEDHGRTRSWTRENIGGLQGRDDRMAALLHSNLSQATLNSRFRGYKTHRAIQLKPM